MKFVNLLFSSGLWLPYLCAYLGFPKDDTDACWLQLLAIVGFFINLVIFVAVICFFGVK